MIETETRREETSAHFVIARPLASGIPPEMAAEINLRWVENLEGFYHMLDAELAQQAKRPGH
jgi:hypothetical protein